MAETAAAQISRRGWVLTMLVLVYTFNFIDRQIVGILAIPIKADLGLTDTQLGLMAGPAFAVFYTTLGVPIAYLADRKSRVWIMTIALSLWSLMTAACGLAGSFWQLFLARLGVGIGEAGGVAPAYSLIADYYPPEQRGRALAQYSFGIPIGSALGIVFGGLIAELIDWRVAFFAVGLAGLVLAPLLRLTVADPPRGQFDQGPPLVAAGFFTVIKTLTEKPAFWLLSIGAASSSMMGYGLFQWLPSFLVRSYGISLLDAALLYGAMLLTAGIAGIWLGGALGDYLGNKRKAYYALVPALAFAGTIPFYLIGVLSPNLWLTAIVLLIPTALGLAWLGPIISAIQHLVPANMRSTASAVFLLINNLIGIALGIFVIGALSDALASRYGDESLRYAILAGTGFYVIAAGFFWLASRRLERDWA